MKGAGWLETDVCYPRLDRAKYEVVSLVRSADILPVIDHPSELDHGEVRGKREAGPMPDLLAAAQAIELQRRWPNNSLRPSAPSAPLRSWSLTLIPCVL